VSTTTTTGETIGGMEAGRIYVRALLDQDGRAVEEEHELYAESLVDRHWNDNDEARKVVRVALDAYLDGYYQGQPAGLKDGFAAGLAQAERRHERRDEMRHGMTDIFLNKLDALDAGTRKDLSEMATALHMVLCWSQGEHTPEGEAPPAD
jgi:hypothetical protein